MDELTGFSSPNDFSTFILRAKLAKRFGVFGQIPMWGGIKLHEFYPPLSTLVVGRATMIGALAIYFLLTFPALAVNKGVLTAVLFYLSYFHLVPLLHYGRYSEFLGYALIILAAFTGNPFVSGLLYGLGALSHPTSLIFGFLLLAPRLDIFVFITAFVVCGWWYVPFILKSRRLPFLEEERTDRLSGVYKISIASMINIVLFLFFPIHVFIFGVLWWLSPITLKDSRKPVFDADILRRPRHFYGIIRKPFFMSSLSREFPGLQGIREETILIEQEGYAGSIDQYWTWAVAGHMLDKGVIVYNGLPSTEVPKENLRIVELPSYSIDELRSSSNNRG